MKSSKIIESIKKQGSEKEIVFENEYGVEVEPTFKTVKGNDGVKRIFCTLFPKKIVSHSIGTTYHKKQNLSVINH